MNFFDTLHAIVIICGAMAGGRIGYDAFGIVGSILGGIVGLVVGGILGRLPTQIFDFIESRKLSKLGTEELRQQLHSDDDDALPELILLELSKRGEDIECELPFICSLLTSEPWYKRNSGLQTLHSHFPEQAKMIAGYYQHESVEECREKVQPLLDQLNK